MHRTANQAEHYREVSRHFGIAGIDRKTLLNWLKRGSREKIGLYRMLFDAVERDKSRKLSG